MYSTVNATWELLGTQAGEAKPKARMQVAMTAVGNNILIHGGFDGGEWMRRWRWCAVGSNSKDVEGGFLFLCLGVFGNVY